MLMSMEDEDAIAMNEQGCRDPYLRLHVPRLQAMCMYVSVCVGCFKLPASSENQYRDVMLSLLAHSWL